MAITIVWSNASPADSDFAADGDDRIRDTRLGIVERLTQLGVYFPSSAAANSGLLFAGPTNFEPAAVSVYANAAGIPDTATPTVILKVTDTAHALGRGVTVINGFLKVGTNAVLTGVKRHVFTFEGTTSGLDQAPLSQLQLAVPQHFSTIVLKEFIVAKNTVIANTNCTFDIKKITPTWAGGPPQTTTSVASAGTSLLSAPVLVAAANTAARSTAFAAVTLAGGDLIMVTLSSIGSQSTLYSASLSIEYA